MQEHHGSTPPSPHWFRFLGASNFLQKIGASGNWAEALFYPSGCHHEGLTYTPSISYQPISYVEAEKSISRLIH